MHHSFASISRKYFLKSTIYVIALIVFSSFMSACGGGRSTHNTEDFSSNSDSSRVILYNIPEGYETEYARWASNMLTYAEQAGQFIMNNTNRDFLLSAVYYDSQWVFYQIADFTGNHSHWNIYAQRAGEIYRESYLVPNNYATSGYWRFPHGIYEEWERTQNANLVSGLRNLRDNPAYSDPESNRWISAWYGQKTSREIAYAIEANILAEKAGVPRDQIKLDLYIDMALQHIDSWVTADWISTDPDDQHVKSFMTGLTACALIHYYEYMTSISDNNSRVQLVTPAIKRIADWLWDNMWVADIGGSSPNFNDLGGTGYGAFRYMSKAVAGKGSTDPSPDLNLLIAPYYAWLYKQTCEISFKQQADLIFAGGVHFAYLGSGKQFNQNYRLSFKYLEWRTEGENTCG